MTAVIGSLIVFVLAGALIAVVVAISDSETYCERQARVHVERIDGTNGDYFGYLEGCRAVFGPDG